MYIAHRAGASVSLACREKLGLDKRQKLCLTDKKERSCQIKPSKPESKRRKTQSRPSRPESKQHSSNKLKRSSAGQTRKRRGARLQEEGGVLIGAPTLFFMPYLLYCREGVFSETRP
jgi:bifunctional DNA-binding transcriptional regulator/antitoxin component of YhaV-PrlF toxin-antitoxin module